MAKKQAAHLPNRLYVNMEDDGDGTFFPISSTDIESQDDGTEIGIYELKTVKTMKVVRSLETRELV